MHALWCTGGELLTLKLPPSYTGRAWDATLALRTAPIFGHLKPGLGGGQVSRQDSLPGPRIYPTELASRLRRSKRSFQRFFLTQTVTDRSGGRTGGREGGGSPECSDPPAKLSTSTAPTLPPQVLIILAENLETDTDRGCGFIAINRGCCTVNISL